MKRLVLVPLAGFVITACQDATEPNASPLPTPLFSTTGYAVGPEIRVTTDLRVDDYPQISGDRIAWFGIENGVYDIYVADWDEISMTWDETQLTGDPATQSSAKISGDRIVWWETLSGLYNVYLAEWNGMSWDVTQFTDDPAMQISPDVSGDRIAWLDYRSSNGEVYVAEWDGSSWNESLVSPSAVSPGEPAIDGDRIVWRDRRHGNWEIYVAEWDEVGTNWVETRITVDAADQSYPGVSGNWIVWHSQVSEANRDIYVAEHTEAGWVVTPIATGEADQLNPAISGDWIVWLERQDASDNYDVYLYDLNNSGNSTEVRITDSSVDHYYPTVWGTCIAWSETRDGNTDLYMVEVSAAIPPPLEAIMEQVDQCVADGGITNQGIGTALKAFLRQTAADVAKEDFGAACARLAHFIDFVGKKVDKQIGASCAQILTDQAQALGGSYGCTW